jgi:glycosyltransferase involved in cell wall biosynthesis
MAESVSIIIPVFNEAENLWELYRELERIKSSTRRKVELIFVDDGSTDGSPKDLKELEKSDKDVKVVRHPRNMGQTAAIASGLKASRGEIIVTIDSDLQNDPMDIPKLVAAITEGGADVASGWRKERKDPYFSKVLPSRIANAIISFVTGISLHDYGCTLKAYRRKFIDNISIHGEMHRFLPAYCAWQGAKVVELEVNHRPRVHGVSKYGLGRTFKVILDLIVLKFVLSYFTKPMYLFGGVGLASFVAGCAVGLFVIYRRIFENGQWISPLFFVGMLFLAVSVLSVLMGLLAEILVRLYFETKRDVTHSR